MIKTIPLPRPDRNINPQPDSKIFLKSIQIDGSEFYSIGTEREEPPVVKQILVLWT